MLKMTTPRKNHLERIKMIDIEECVHGMGNPQHCVLCKGSSLPNVYVTAGGMSYHQTPNCPNLIKGQAKVENPAPIETLPHGSEKVLYKKPCKKCKPKIQGSQRKVDQAKSKSKLSDLYSSMPVLQRAEASGKDTKAIARAKRKAKNQKANRMINYQLAIASKAHKVGDVDTVVEALNKAMVLVPKRKDKNGNYTWQSTIDHIVKMARAFGVSVKALPDGGFYFK